MNGKKPGKAERSLTYLLTDVNVALTTKMTLLMHNLRMATLLGPDN